MDFPEDAEEDDQENPKDPDAEDELAETCEATEELSDSDDAWGCIALSDGNVYKGGASNSSM